MTVITKGEKRVSQTAASTSFEYIEIIEQRVVKDKAQRLCRYAHLPLIKFFAEGFHLRTRAAVAPRLTVCCNRHRAVTLGLDSYAQYVS